jgi:hypothetical protein
MERLPEPAGLNPDAREALGKPRRRVGDREHERTGAGRKLGENGRNVLDELGEQQLVVRAPSYVHVCSGKPWEEKRGHPRGRGRERGERELVVGLDATVDATAPVLRQVPLDGCRHAGALGDPLRMLQCDAAERQARASGRRCCSRWTNERSAVWQSQRLIETEDRSIAERAERTPIDAAKPSLRDILEQKQPAFIAPRTPARCVLRETEVMDEVQRARPPTETLLELVLVRREVRPNVVEARGDAGLEKRLHFGAVVVARHERLVAGAEPEHAYALAEAVASTAEQPEGIDAERERERRRGPAHVCVDRQRRPQLELCCRQPRPFQICGASVRPSIVSHEPAAAYVWVPMLPASQQLSSRAHGVSTYSVGVSRSMRLNITAAP